MKIRSWIWREWIGDAQSISRNGCGRCRAFLRSRILDLLDDISDGV